MHLVESERNERLRTLEQEIENLRSMMEYVYNFPDDFSLSKIEIAGASYPLNGVLGGDQIPSNLSSTAPTLDNFVTICVDGNGDGLPDNGNKPVGVDLADGAAPAAAIALHGNTPNPFNPTTTIRFTVPGTKGAMTEATLEVFDLSGRRVATLLDGPVRSGPRAVVWNGADDRGRSVASGLYFARLRAAGETATRKMVLIK